MGNRLEKDPAPELVDLAFSMEVEEGALLYPGMSLADYRNRNYTKRSSSRIVKCSS